jgi:hypothetical protein
MKTKLDPNNLTDSVLTLRMQARWRRTVFLWVTGVLLFVHAAIYITATLAPAPWVLLIMHMDSLLLVVTGVIRVATLVVYREETVHGWKEQYYATHR